MAKITIKNILDNYIPQNYLRKGISGRPLTWKYNEKLLKFGIPITLAWIIFSFLAHGIDKQFFVFYAWVWGVTNLISLFIVLIAYFKRDDIEKINKWAAPITFLIMVAWTLNVNLSLTFFDDNTRSVGLWVIYEVTVYLLVLVLLHAVVHIIIAIISIYKGKNLAEKISSFYVSGVLVIAVLYCLQDTNFGMMQSLHIMMSVFMFVLLFNIHSVYLNFHPEKCPQNKETLSKSKKYLK